MLGSVLASTDTKSRERPRLQSYRGQRQGLSSLVTWRAPFPALHLPFSLTWLSYVMPRMCLTPLCPQPPSTMPGIQKMPGKYLLDTVQQSSKWCRITMPWFSRLLPCLTWGQSICDIVCVETICVTISPCGPAWAFAWELWVLQLAPLILESITKVGLTFFK